MTFEELQAELQALRSQNAHRPEIAQDEIFPEETVNLQRFLEESKSDGTMSSIYGLYSDVQQKLSQLTLTNSNLAREKQRMQKEMKEDQERITAQAKMVSVAGD